MQRIPNSERNKVIDSNSNFTLELPFENIVQTKHTASSRFAHSIASKLFFKTLSLPPMSGHTSPMVLGLRLGLK